MFFDLSAKNSIRYSLNFVERKELETTNLQKDSLVDFRGLYFLNYWEIYPKGALTKLICELYMSFFPSEAHCLNPIFIKIWRNRNILNFCLWKNFCLISRFFSHCQTNQPNQIYSVSKICLHFSIHFLNSYKYVVCILGNAMKIAGKWQNVSWKINY